MMLFFTLFGAATPARSIIDEHRLGTLPRLFTTPTPRSVILGGKYIAVFLVVLLQTVILLVAGRLLFGAHWGAIGPVVVLVIAGALVAASLGLLTVSFAKTPAQAGAGERGHLRVPGPHQRQLHRDGQHRRHLRRRPPLQPARLAARRLEPRACSAAPGASIALPVLAALGFALVVLRHRHLLLPETVRVRPGLAHRHQGAAADPARPAGGALHHHPAGGLHHLPGADHRERGRRQRSLPMAVVDQDGSPASQQLRRPAGGLAPARRSRP